jgi:hypothetical protein
MIAMTRALVLGALVIAAAAARCPADVTLPNSPAAYRLHNCAIAEPRTAGCGRCDPLPPYNRGFFLNNPRGTGMDDPWRPPRVWPQTRYPVVPAYARPSYGYYETGWRVLPVCGTPPWVRTPPIPEPPPALPAPTQRPAVATPASGPRPAASPNANTPESGPPRAVPPKATPPRRNEALPAPNLPPANEPKTDRGEIPLESPVRAAMADPDGFSSNVDNNSEAKSHPDIAVRAF